jgi:hypothetical protein
MGGIHEKSPSYIHSTGTDIMVGPKPYKTSLKRVLFESTGYPAQPGQTGVSIR